MKNGKFLKVLQVLGDSKYGGGTYLILEITKKLIKEGYQVSVNTSDPITINKFKKLGVNIIKIKEMRRNINFLFDAIALIKLLFAIKKEKFDIIHTHTSKGGFLGRTAATIARTPIIIHHVHGFAFNEFNKNKLSGRFFIFLEKFAGKFQDKLIFVNDEDRISAQKYKIGDKKRYLTIKNCIDITKFDIEINVEDKRKSIGLNLNDILVGFIGRLTEQKAPNILIKSVKKVKKFIPNIKVLIVGEGLLEKEMKILSRELNVENEIVFLGFRTDVSELLKMIDIYVLPSRRGEGLPIGILEAMATKKPIIATNIKGNRELIYHKKTGLLIPPDNPYELANAIIYLIKNKKEGLKMASVARNLVIEKFSIERMLNEILKVYVNLIEKKLCITKLL